MGLAGGEGKVGEKGEGFTPHLWVLSGRWEVLGGGGSTEQCDRRRWLLGAAALRCEGAVMAGLRSFTGMRGFRSRGQLGAWMAGVGSSTVSCGWRRPWWGGGRVAWSVGIPLSQNGDGGLHEL